MSMSELVVIFSWIGSAGLGAVLAAIIVFLVLKAYLPSYLSEKGKNLATKEDIGRITDEIEKVRAQYAKQLQEISHQNTLILEERKERQQMRVAALDRRLQAYQEAFTLWRRLIFNVHNAACSSIVMECQDWWDKNSLYLSQEAREAFYRAYHAASLHKDLLQDKSKPDLIKENWKQIENCGEVILKGADLPALGKEEVQRISDQGKVVESPSE